MRCPICRKAITYKGNPFRPFCSERCKLVDLNNWLSERYRISTPVADSGKNAPTPSHKPRAKRARG